MKIIDLLVKIANNEIKLGTKFIWHYRNDDIILTYMERYGALGLFFENGLTPDGEINWIGLFERFNYAILNDEIEIIEEDKKIEKITMCTSGVMGFDGVENIATELKNKINELIDEVNKLKIENK